MAGHHLLNGIALVRDRVGSDVPGPGEARVQNRRMSPDSPHAQHSPLDPLGTSQAGQTSQGSRRSKLTPGISSCARRCPRPDRGREGREAPMSEATARAIRLGETRRSLTIVSIPVDHPSAYREHPISIAASGATPPDKSRYEDLRFQNGSRACRPEHSCTSPHMVLFRAYSS
jgi:hypothetical protein